MRSVGGYLVLLLSVVPIHFANVNATNHHRRLDISEQELLREFYIGTNGPTWLNKTGWSIFGGFASVGGLPICSWHGVYCENKDGDSGVLRLDLSDNRLSGNIPPQFWQMPNLLSVLLQGNNIQSGGFQGIHNSTTLEEVVLTGNDLTDLFGIEKAPDSLKSLHVSSNKLIAKNVPTGLFSLDKLLFLSLSFNHEMDAEIPTQIGNMASLRALYWSHSELKGTIPTEIGLLNKLKVLLLSENKLEGQIPTEMGNLLNLQALAIHNNEYGSGALTGRLPAFENLVFLREIFLDGNALSGNLPARLLKNSAVPNQTITINLANNQFSGSIPPSYRRFQKLKIDLTGNQIDHIPDRLCEMNGWMNGQVESIGCNAILCPVGSFEPNHGRETAEDSPCIPCQNSVDNAPFMGSYGCDINEAPINDVEVLARFYIEMGRENWYKADGWSILDFVDDPDEVLTMNLNHCGWFGVTCNDAERVVEIRLGGNGLRGSIPRSVFQLPELAVLDLSDNAIRLDDDFGFGYVGDSLSLRQLILDDTDIRAWDGVGDAFGLEYLSVSFCDLSGPLTDEVYGLQSLKTFRAQTAGITGRLTEDIEFMASLKELNLRDNDMTGPIPPQLGSLAAIRSIVLSENDFTGALPEDLNSFPNLEFFDYTRYTVPGPGLTGPILAFNNVPKLKEIRLDYNSLSGTIPSNFLKAIDDSKRDITVSLNANQLSGPIPAELQFLDSLNLDLRDNQISDVPEVLCQKSNWMMGQVGIMNNSCSAILCPAETYNFGGVEWDLNDPCIECPSALYWGSTDCDTDDSVNIEKEILDNFFYATAGNEWGVNDNWGVPGASVCTYAGVTCDGDDETGGVVKINLNNFGLSGTVPTDIWSLPDLRVLSLERNDILASFEGIDLASNLEEIDLSFTNFDDLDFIEDAPPSLTHLILAYTNLENRLHGNLFTLSNLKVLDLNGNFFRGPIPTQIGKMSSLETLLINSNELTGFLPTEVGQLSNLKVINLDDNILSGSLPTELGMLTNLEAFSLQGQRSFYSLYGELYDFAPNAKLTRLNLAKNSLEGEIPPTLLSSVDTTKPIQIDLSSNEITGSVPVELDLFVSMNINLASNRISDLPDVFCDNTEWMDGLVGFLGDDGCDAILCPQGTAAEFGRQVEPGIPCEQCNFPDLSPYFGSTECNESPEGIERRYLTMIYDALNGPNWKNQKNWKTTKPICRWYGVTCKGDRNNDEGVEMIELESNNLDDSNTNTDFSSAFYSLPHLKHLDLRGNHIRVEFNRISLTMQLEVLLLSGTEVSSLDGIGEAHNLKFLHLTNNDLEENLSESGLFDVVTLESLFLSYNSLIGELSPKIGQLLELRELYLFGNAITGSIPTEMGRLRKLETLMMGGNQLSGTIPIEMENLVNLESLSLFDQQSNSRLTGNIPAFANLTNLKSLDLASNRLSGFIPENLLENSAVVDEAVIINFDFNLLSGGVPASLDRFKELQLGIVGNGISTLPATLCDDDNSAWMQGAVESYGCSAIACPQGTFGADGRQTLNSTCRDCNSLSSVHEIGKVKCSGPATEKDILLEIFQASDEPWSSCTDGWTDNSEPICGWFGISCDQGHTLDNFGVTGLSLEKCGITGTIPSIVWDLPYLAVLNVKENDVDFDFRGIEKATSLDVLYLSETNIRSFEGISSAPKLRVIHLTGNKMQGYFPEEILDLGDSLEQIYVAYNSFSGPIPTRINELTSLTHFYAFDNDFSGTIPVEMTELENLQYLVLSENRLSGQIPEELGSMPSLKLLSSFRKSKSGTKFSGTLPSFANAPQLTDIYLDYNNIHGTIPSNFLSSSAGADYVSLSHNQLTGTVPSELASLTTSLRVNLAGNRLTELPSEFCTNTDWNEGYVGVYSCDAIMCPPGTFSPIGFQNSSDTECQTCDVPSHAPFWGGDSCELKLTDEEVLIKLYNECGGDNWKNSDGWLSTSTHYCSWHGIVCTIGQRIVQIRLGANNLVGTVPNEVFDLSFLHLLWLYSNPIEISFENIASAKDLIELRLDSTHLSSVTGIGKSASIQSLNLRFNQLDGKFPTEILNLVNLRSLSIANNKLTGFLPTSFGSLQDLETLRLGSNRLSGGIPTFEDLHHLVNLDLSDNNFSGSIPSKFLKNIPSDSPEIVDLSTNSLTGSVPTELNRFETLIIFLKDNMIDALAPRLCDTDNRQWNGGDVAHFGCNAILCPPGTASIIGRQSSTSTACVECNSGGSGFYGQSTCGNANIGTGSASVTSAAITSFVRFRSGFFLLLPLGMLLGTGFE